MANVIIRSYNTFFDHKTKVQFNPILDKISGRYIGLAQIAEDLVPYFSKNPAYEVVTDAVLNAITGNGQAGQDDAAPETAPDPTVFAKNSKFMAAAPDDPKSS